MIARRGVATLVILGAAGAAVLFTQSALLDGMDLFAARAPKARPFSVLEANVTAVPPLPNMSRVCVLVPTCSRGMAWARLEDTSLIRYPLSSFKQTYEPTNFSYTIYVGYDTGDAFFDTPATLQALRAWFDANMDPGIELKTHAVNNSAQKPGPVMNFLSRQAHSDGCEYMYRINDDTEMTTAWTTPFVEALKAFKPPFHGVVGPTCNQGNTAIMTHDFVHRRHLDVFETHYPPELTDWWLDDWISSVYGEHNTLKLPNVVVQHHLISTRYKVGREALSLLPTLLEKGRQRIAAFWKGAS